jgi:uncharacterized protein (TIGR02270 family)
MPEFALDGVVGVHWQEAASLCETRIAQIRMPHVTLLRLGRLDDRLLAHLDGLAMAGEHGQRLIDAERETPSRGGASALAVHAIESGQPDSLERLWDLANDTPSVADGLVTAFGWVEPRYLQGVVRSLLRHEDPRRRAAGLAACAMHRTDPGLETGPWLNDPSPAVRARALRTAGELGLSGLASRSVAAMADDDVDCQFWAAWTAVLLGNRGVALEALGRTALDAGRPHRERAFRLTLQTLESPASHALLQDVAKDSAQLRWLIQGSGIAGDATYAPWLIGHMAKPETARLAGEAFTLITGADLDALQLWRAQPDDVESGPNENPGDENVDMDPGEGLMWPDQQKVEKWWAANNSRFQKGTRYFMGAPVTREHCMDVLKNGYQRQRILAAHYLSLMNPGTPLFNTSAPAWRQQRLLAQMH